MAVIPEVRNLQGDECLGLEEVSVNDSQKKALHVVCDACPYCSDTCSNPDCGECHESTPVRIDAGLSPCMGGATRYYTMCEVRRHNNHQSAWLVCGNDIYDATEYIASHPGGKNSILKKAGGAADCTADLMFHSRSGRQVWRRYLVGKLKPCGRESGLCQGRQWWQFWG